MFRLICELTFMVTYDASHSENGFPPSNSNGEALMGGISTMLMSFIRPEAAKDSCRDVLLL